MNSIEPKLRAGESGLSVGEFVRSLPVRKATEFALQIATRRCSTNLAGQMSNEIKVAAPSVAAVPAIVALMYLPCR